MGSYTVSGFDALKLKFEKHEEDCGGYPFKIPEVYLRGEGVYDYKFPIFDREDDSVILVRNECVLEYKSSWHREMLFQNADGKPVWVAASLIEDEENENVKFLGEDRVVHQYTVTEYDVEKREKRTCSVILEKPLPMTMEDCYRLSDIVDKELLGNCFKIKDTKDFAEICF
jgi:hypothetical protein